MELTKSVTRRAFSMSGLAGLAALSLPLQSLGQESAVVGRFGSADEEKANVKVVEQFCAAWSHKDLDTIASLLADDCSFRSNQKSPPVVGKQMVTERFKGDFARASFELKILKAVGLGPVVLTQRDDIITPLNGNASRTIRIAAGMFFVDNGKIVEWTDFGLR